MKKIILKLSCMCCMMVALMMSGKMNVKAGTYGNPTDVRFGVTYTDILIESNPNQYYRIILTSSGTLTLDMKTEAWGATHFILTDSDGNNMFTQSVGDFTTPNNTSVVELELTKGVYNLRVDSYLFGWSANSGYGKYTLIPYFKSGKADYENNNSFEDAAMIYKGESISGHLAQNANTEYFKIKSTKKGNLVLNGKTSSTYGFFNVYDSKKTLLGELILRKTQSNGKGSITIPVKKGTYYIEAISEKPVYANKKYGTFNFNVDFPTNTIVKGNLKYKIQSKNLLSVTGVKNKNSTVVTIPDTLKCNGKKYKVTKIEKAAFKNLKKVEKIVIGKNINSIGKEAFYNCIGLTNLQIKTSKLTSDNIGNKAFSYVGKNNYKKLKVKVPAKNIKSYKKILRKKGLSSKVLVVK